MELKERIKKIWENDFKFSLHDYKSCLESDLYMAQYNGEWDKIPLLEKELKNIKMWEKNPLLIPFDVGVTNHTILPQKSPIAWLYEELGEEKEEILMTLLIGAENYYEFNKILNYVLGKQKEIYYLLPTDFRKEIKKKFLEKGKVTKKRKSFIKILIEGDEALKILKKDL